MIKINLLPVRAEKIKENIRRQVSIAILSFFLVFVVIGYMYISISRQISSLELKLTSVNEEMVRFEKEIEKIEQFKEKRRILEEKIKVMRRLEENKSGPLRLLAELSDVIPEKAWLVSLKEKKARIEIKGVASDNKTIADFMNRIEGSPVFKDVELAVSQVASGGSKTKAGKGFKSFTMRFMLESRV